ncbi:MAG: hypothetical protein AAGA38_07190 [Pseudomonadota bacterium]
MSETTLDQTSFVKAVWTGRLERAAAGSAPKLTASLNGLVELDLDVTAAPGRPRCWNVQLRIPEQGLSEGAQLIVIEDSETQDVLYRIPIIAGIAATDDIRAEIAALRAELDQLRAAFRKAERSNKTG